MTEHSGSVSDTAAAGQAAAARKVSKTSVLVLVVAVAAAFGLILFMVRRFSAFGFGEDWFVFRETGWRLLNGQPLYGTPVGGVLYYYNPPWMVLLLLPLEVWPFQVSYALLLLISLAAVIFLAQRFKLGLFATLLTIVSPSVIYTLSHGQVDILVVAGCFLAPSFLVPLVALIKPQAAILTVLSIPRSRWVLALAVTLAGVGLSFVFFGFWPAVVAKVPGPVIDLPGLVKEQWPLRLCLCAVMVAFAIYKKDNLLLLAASPLLSPYVHAYSFIGLSLVIARLKPLPAALLIAAWWAVGPFIPIFG
jgi:hypothetical protein